VLWYPCAYKCFDVCFTRVHIWTRAYASPRAPSRLLLPPASFLCSTGPCLRATFCTSMRSAQCWHLLTLLHGICQECMQRCNARTARACAYILTLRAHVKETQHKASATSMRMYLRHILISTGTLAHENDRRALMMHTNLATELRTTHIRVAL
jgi:hypothetical protein